MISIGDRVQVVSNLITGLTNACVGHTGIVVSVDYDDTFGIITVEFVNPAMPGGFERLNFFFEELKIVD
jgi:hypothetical protein